MLFITKKKNSSRSVFEQLIKKIDGNCKVIKTLDCPTAQHDIEKLVHKSKHEILKLQAHPPLFFSENYVIILYDFLFLNNTSIKICDSEIILGKIYD